LQAGWIQLARSETSSPLEVQEMIISHKHKYLFIEVPHTGTTAISKELRANYDGVPILRKHAYYPEFLAVATPEERKYFVFAGIRNPLDETVSLYFKYKTDHEGNFSNPQNRRDQGGWLTPTDLAKFRYIQETQSEFAPYFLKFFTQPYTNVSSLSGHALNFVIRFENLQEDLTKVLNILGIEQTRPLPFANKTGGRKRDFRSYYTPECHERARRVFGPFMQKWGYEFPPEWGITSVPWSSQVHFQMQDAIKRFYWTNLKWGTTPYARAFRAIWLRSSKPAEM
jgi:hypothetical protein